MNIVYSLSEPAVHVMGRGTTYEKVVIRSPVSPNEEVHAGNRQLTTFTTTMMAKQSQKERPKAPPIIPVLRVATAILALNLDRSQSSYHNIRYRIEETLTRMCKHSRLWWYCAVALHR